jgi:hypothetical protein
MKERKEKSNKMELRLKGQVREEEHKQNRIEKKTLRNKHKNK